jgi:hypothetical protein
LPCVCPLQVDFNYEGHGAPQMAQAWVANFAFSLAIRPRGLLVTASLGNMLLLDGTLPPGNPYRNICDLRVDTTVRGSSLL